jgi:muramoyltetrapeptide carboxypeptidase
LAQTGAITWAGPALGEDFGAEEGPDDIMEACFDDLVCGHGEGSGWRLPASDVPALAALRVTRPATETDAETEPDDEDPSALRAHHATLWGGNLTVLCSLIGTPYLPGIDGGILFLEDVNEHPYRIERQLTQLLHAGILDRQQAVLLGSFNRYQASPHDRGFKLQTVVAWLRSKTRTPVLTGLPFGHVPTKVLLPVGQSVELMVQGRDALLYWG